MKKGRKKLDSFLRLFCVGIACVSILAVGTFALVGSGLFDGVVKSRVESSVPTGNDNIAEAGKDGDENLEDADKENNQKPENPDEGNNQNPENPSEDKPGEGQEGGEQQPGGDDGQQGGSENPSEDNQKKDFDFKFVEKDGKIYVEEIGDLAIDENGKVELPTETEDGKEVSGVVSGAGDNKNIKEITIPEGYTDIEDGAFEGADNVTKIVIESKEVYDALDEDLFGIGSDKRKNVEIFVNSSVDDETNAMLEDEDFYIEEVVTETNKDGNSVSYNRYFYNTTDFKIRNKSILGFTTEGAKKNLKEITLGSESLGVEVMSIADGAFKGNKNLTKVTLEDNILTIGLAAFYGCTNITDIDISTRISWVKFNDFRFSGIIQVVPVDPNATYRDRLFGTTCKGSEFADNQVMIGDVNSVNVLKLYVKDIEKFYDTAVEYNAITCDPNNRMILDFTESDEDYNGEKLSMVIKDATCYFHREEFIALSQDEIVDTFVNNSEEFSYGSLDFTDYIYTTTEDGEKKIDSLAIIKLGVIFFNNINEVVITIPEAVDIVSVDEITNYDMFDAVVFENTSDSWVAVLADGTVTTIKFTDDAKENVEIFKTLQAGSDIVKVK